MGRAYLSRGKGKTMTTEKTYKVQRTQKIIQDCIINANSKKEALEIAHEIGDFNNDDYEIVTTYKVNNSI